MKCQRGMPAAGSVLTENGDENHLGEAPIRPGDPVTVINERPLK